MENRTLEIKERDRIGKEAAKKIRREGYIPAVLYGHKGTKSLSVKAYDFISLFEEIGEHSIITLNIEGKERAEVIVRDFQIHPVKKNIMHVDFFEIEKGKLLKTVVPIKINGISVGVKKGGILEVFTRDVEIECLPKDIPDFIAVDIENLDIGDSLHINNMAVDKKISILANPEQVVVTIGTPSVIKAPEEKVEEELEEVAVPEEGEAPVEETKPEEQ
jgi:large subunit ribosomal protein L25